MPARRLSFLQVVMEYRATDSPDTDSECPRHVTRREPATGVMQRKGRRGTNGDAPSRHIWPGMTCAHSRRILRHRAERKPLDLHRPPDMPDGNVEFAGHLIRVSALVDVSLLKVGSASWEAKRASPYINCREDLLGRFPRDRRATCSRSCHRVETATA